MFRSICVACSTLCRLGAPFISINYARFFKVFVRVKGYEFRVQNRNCTDCLASGLSRVDA